MVLRSLCALLIVLVIGAGNAWPAQVSAHRAAAANAAGQAAPGQPHPSAPAPSIAAVVNDDVISFYDLASRARMVLISSNIPDTPENRQRIAPQVLRSLIDEKLELQEAKRQNVTVTEEEMKKGIDQLEKQNNMRPGQLDEFLKARGIERAAIVDQLTASLLWAKLVKRQAAQGMTISDDEIDDALKRLKEHAGEPQSRVGEIFLAIDNPAQEDQVRQLADRLTAQMKQGARFSAVARQFSQAASAAVGGDIGYMRPDQLPPELGKVVATLKPGELSSPIRSGGGYYLLLVLDRKLGAGSSEQEPIYDIVQVVFAFPPKANEAAKHAALAEAASVRGQAKDCPSMLKIGKEKAPQLSSQGKLAASQIAPEMRKVIEAMPTGQVSQPIVQKNGVGVIMICDKSTGKSPTGVTREEVADTLLRQRLDTMSRRYMRDLRRTAYVDVRAGGA
jgi:peptidyl-prolyl cis-trans isomerase SurA